MGNSFFSKFNGMVLGMLYLYLNLPLPEALFVLYPFSKISFMVNTLSQMIDDLNDEIIHHL